MNVGEVHSFDVSKFCAVVEMFIDADEVERALWLLDNPPAYYRDNKPKELMALRDEILKARITAHAYSISNLDCEVTRDRAVKVLGGNLRGLFIENAVRDYNAEGKTPHIVDMGPGEYFVPIGLKEKGYQFTYKPIALDTRAYEGAKPFLSAIPDKAWDENAPYLFIACEVIEHLAEPLELGVEMMRHGHRKANGIHLSTPLYTFDPTGQKDWRKLTGLPHLRAYTPQEFLNEATAIFPGYDWKVAVGPNISLVGALK